MNGINVSSDVLERLQTELPLLTPEARKAAAYVLENPRDVGVSTVREIALAADVKPNTVVRMARQVGFEGYDDFREPFREAIRQGRDSFPDRARFLQALSAEGKLGSLYSQIIGSTIANLEDTFAGITVAELKDAATTIWNSDRVFTYGVGVNNANARNFSYLASTGMVEFHAIPKDGASAIDDLAWINKNDVLVAITSKPYRREVIEAVEIAKEQGATIIGISDSPASPLILNSDHGFIVANDTPQFFPSSIATVALLETLLSFVIASASPQIVERVEKFHARRQRLGLYVED